MEVTMETLQEYLEELKQRSLEAITGLAQNRWGNIGMAAIQELISVLEDLDEVDGEAFDAILSEFYAWQKENGFAGPN